MNGAAKTYLCIGGPQHGKHLSVYNDAREVCVAHYGQTYVGAFTVDARNAFTETRYTVKTIANRESKEAVGNDGSRATVTVDVRVDVLVHESILTFEETVAYYRKLTKGAVGSSAVIRAVAMLDTVRLAPL